MLTLMHLHIIATLQGSDNAEGQRISKTFNNQITHYITATLQGSDQTLINNISYQAFDPIKSFTYDSSLTCTHSHDTSRY